MPNLGRFKETDANIRHMDSARSGLRRAAATSWALAGIGVAGVAGASSLAYADTFKPAATAPVEVEVSTAPADVAPAAVADLPPAPTTVDPPPVPAPVTTQAPVSTEASVKQYIPKQTYQEAPAPVTHQTQAPAPTKASTSTTTTRHVNAPSTVKSPNYSPHVTISHGS